MNIPAFKLYPPYLFLMKVLENCPTSGYSYMILWANRDLEDKVVFHKKLDIHSKKMQRDIRKLKNQGVLDILEENKVSITINLKPEIHCIEQIPC